MNYSGGRNTRKIISNKHISGVINRTERQTGQTDRTDNQTERMGKSGCQHGMLLSTHIGAPQFLNRDLNRSSVVTEV